MNTSKIPSNEIPFSRRWLLGWIPFWIYSVFVFQGAVAPFQDLPAWLLDIPDKAVHAGEYFLLFFVAFNAFVKARSVWFRSKTALKSFVYCLLMGVTTEWAQSFTPDRHADIWDWAADFVGAGIALLIYFGVSRCRLAGKL